jgi:hypothetical protein
VPVTTKIPAPMEAPIPRRIRSKTPSRRERPRPELSRAAFSAGETKRLDRRADDQKREQQEDDEEVLPIAIEIEMY